MFRRRRGSEVAMFNRWIIKKIDWRWAPLPVVPNINLDLFDERFVYDVLLVPLNDLSQQQESWKSRIVLSRCLLFFLLSSQLQLRSFSRTLFCHFCIFRSRFLLSGYPHTALRLHPGFVWPIDSVCRHTEQDIRTQGFIQQLHFVGMPTNSLRGTPCSELQTWSYGAVYW